VGRWIAIADNNRQIVVSILKDETTDVSRSYSYAPFTCMVSLDCSGRGVEKTHPAGVAAWVHHLSEGPASYRRQHAFRSPYVAHPIEKLLLGGSEVILRQHSI
jgi:hypothetical protein